MEDTGSQAVGIHLHMDMYVDALRVDPEPYVTLPFFSLSGGLEVTPIPEEAAPREEHEMPRLYHQVNTNGDQAYLLENTFGIEIISADHARAIAKAQNLDFSAIPQINEFDYNAVQQSKQRDLARLRSILADISSTGGGGFTDADRARLQAVPTAEQNGAAARSAIVK